MVGFSDLQDESSMFSVWASSDAILFGVNPEMRWMIDAPDMFSPRGAKAPGAATIRWSFLESSVVELESRISRHFQGFLLHWVIGLLLFLFKYALAYLNDRTWHWNTPQVFSKKASSFVRGGPFSVYSQPDYILLIATLRRCSSASRL